MGTIGTFIYIFLPIFLVLLVFTKKTNHENEHHFWQDQPWGNADVLLIIIFASSLQFLGLLLGVFKIVHYYYIFIYGSFILLILLGALLYWILFGKYKIGYSVLGISKTSFFLNILIGLSAFLLYESLATLSAFLLNDNLFQSKAQLFIKIGLNQLPVFDVFIYIAGLVVVAPVVEECVFRGFLYGPFQKRIGALGGICLTSAIWSITHVHFKAFFKFFLLGMILCYLYKATKSLIPCITMHCMMNLSRLISYIYWINNT